MSEFQGAFYTVSMQLRPATVIAISNYQQEVLIEEPCATFFSIDDFVFQADAEKVRKIWLKSLSESTPQFFHVTSDQATPEERVIEAAAMAAAKIDRSLLEAKVANMDMAIPERYSVVLPPTDLVMRQEAIETLVPFNKIREILLQREKNHSMPKIGHIALEAHRYYAQPRSKMN